MPYPLALPLGRCPSLHMYSSGRRLVRTTCPSCETTLGSNPSSSSSSSYVRGALSSSSSSSEGAAAAGALALSRCGSGCSRHRRAPPRRRSHVQEYSSGMALPPPPPSPPPPAPPPLDGPLRRLSAASHSLSCDVRGYHPSGAHHDVRDVLVTSRRETREHRRQSSSSSMLQRVSGACGAGGGGGGGGGGLVRPTPLYPCLPGPASPHHHHHHHHFHPHRQPLLSSPAAMAARHALCTGDPFTCTLHSPGRLYPAPGRALRLYADVEEEEEEVGGGGGSLSLRSLSVTAQRGSSSSDPNPSDCSLECDCCLGATARRYGGGDDDDDDGHNVVDSNRSTYGSSEPKDSSDVSSYDSRVYRAREGGASGSSEDDVEKGEGGRTCSPLALLSSTPLPPANRSSCSRKTRALHGAVVVEEPRELSPQDQEPIVVVHKSEERSDQIVELDIRDERQATKEVQEEESACFVKVEEEEEKEEGEEGRGEIACDVKGVGIQDVCDVKGLDRQDVCDVKGLDRQDVRDVKGLDRQGMCDVKDVDRRGGCDVKGLDRQAVCDVKDVDRRGVCDLCSAQEPSEGCAVCGRGSAGRGQAAVDSPTTGTSDKQTGRLPAQAGEECSSRRRRGRREDGDVIERIRKSRSSELHLSKGGVVDKVTGRSGHEQRARYSRQLPLTASSVPAPSSSRGSNSGGAGHRRTRSASCRRHSSAVAAVHRSHSASNSRSYHHHHHHHQPQQQQQHYHHHHNPRTSSQASSRARPPSSSSRHHHHLHHHHHNNHRPQHLAYSSPYSSSGPRHGAAAGGGGGGGGPSSTTSSTKRLTSSNRRYLWALEHLASPVRTRSVYHQHHQYLEGCDMCTRQQALYLAAAQLHEGGGGGGGRGRRAIAGGGGSSACGSEHVGVCRTCADRGEEGERGRNPKHSMVVFTEPQGERGGVCLLVACLTSQQHATDLLGQFYVLPH